MIDNLELIKGLLHFESEDDFYHLQIIKRKKDNPEIGSNSQIIKTYYVTSIEYLEEKFFEIRVLCDINNARACINLNKRSFEKIAFHLLKKISDQIMNKDFRSVRKAYESVCGEYSSEKNKKFIIDIDGELDELESVTQFINFECKPEGNKIICVIPTKNGCHLITSPFDLKNFKYQFPLIDVHKNNPTILYIPNR
jgi:hypothetical protein